MRLAYPVGTPDTRKPMLAWQGDPARVLPALREIGYTGVELFVRDPWDMDVDRFVKLVNRSGLEVPAVGTGPLVSEDGLTFTAPQPEVRQAAVRRAESVVRFAALFGAQVNVGKLRGDLCNGMPEPSWRWMDDGFERLCATAVEHDVQITLEPQNRSVINNLNTTRQALDWLAAHRYPNLSLMLDVYHMDREDPSVLESLRAARGCFRHVHVADRHRGVPGTGEIDFLEILGVLKAAGYARYLAVEIEQRPDSSAAAGAAHAYLRTAMKEVGLENWSA